MKLKTRIRRFKKEVKEIIEYKLQVLFAFGFIGFMFYVVATIF